MVRARDFLAATLGAEAAVALLVLGPEDWPGRSPHPVYGMPNCAGGNLIVAGVPNPFWQGFVDLVAAAAPTQEAALRAAYPPGGGGAAWADGALDLSPFFDLLAVHELAHVFLQQAPFGFPRRWLTEFFGNLCLHAYVAAAEPAALPQLTAFPAAVAAVDPAAVPHHSLAAFEALYEDVGPLAYGWYQCRLHAAARRVYDAGGVAALRRLWDAYAVPDARLAATLTRDVHPTVAAILETWPG